MRLVITTCVVLAIAAPSLAQPRSQALVETLRSLDQQFICPERLRADAARREEVQHFSQSLAAERLSYQQALKVRANFLTRHGCKMPSIVGPASAAAAG